MESIIVLKHFILSILAVLGLISSPKIQEQPSQQNALEYQSPRTKMLSQEAQKLSSHTQNNQEIIDINPVSDPHIIPSDLERTRMLSESFCGPLQAQLFAGIREMNRLKIDDAIARGADVNKPTNCWRPIDEAIEQVFAKKEGFILEHLLKKGARVSEEHIVRMKCKYLIFETNITTDPEKMEITLGQVKTAEEKNKQITTINHQLKEQQELCTKIASLLDFVLKRQQLNEQHAIVRASNTPQISLEASAAAAAAATDVNSGAFATAAKK